MFVANRIFRRDYNRLFSRDPIAASLFLLLTECADEKEQVRLGPKPEVELADLMAAQFDSPRAYQLPEGPKR